MNYYYLEKRSKNLYLDLMIHVLTYDKTIFNLLFQNTGLRIYSCKSHYKVTDMCQNKRNIDIRIYNTIH